MYLPAKTIGPDGPGTAMVQRSVGLGCGCGCNKGMGLFDSGMDFTQWTWQEWFVTGLGGYVLVSMFFTGRRAVRQVKEGVTGRVRRTRRKIAAKIAGD